MIFIKFIVNFWLNCHQSTWCGDCKQVGKMDNVEKRGILFEWWFMPNRTGHEDIAINILDYLFLHDVATMSTFSDAKNIFYPDFLGTLDYINSARSHHGIKADIYQHFISCGVELLTNYSQPAGELRIRVDCALKELTSEVVKHGFVANDFISDLNELNNEYKFYDLAKERLCCTKIWNAKRP